MKEIVNVVCQDKLTIFCNQENFLLKSNAYKIQQTFPLHQVFIKPAVSNGHDRGRAKNGMFIAVPECLGSNIEDISPDFLQSTSVKNQDENIVFSTSKLIFPV